MSTYNLTLAEALSGRGEAKLASTLPLQKLETSTNLQASYLNLSRALDGTAAKFQQLQTKIDSIQISSKTSAKSSDQTFLEQINSRRNQILLAPLKGIENAVKGLSTDNQNALITAAGIIAAGIAGIAGIAKFGKQVRTVIKAIEKNGFRGALTGKDNHNIQKVHVVDWDKSAIALVRNIGTGFTSGPDIGDKDGKKNQNKSKSRLGRLGNWIKSIGSGTLNTGKALPGATAGMLGIVGSGTYLKAKLSTAAQTALKAITDVTNKAKDSLSNFWSADKKHNTSKNPTSSSKSGLNTLWSSGKEAAGGLLKQAKKFGPFRMLAAYDLFTTWNSDQSTSQKIKDTGNIAGGMGGAALGAAIGTAILPGVGTIIGGLLGGFGGELAGGELSQKLSTYLDINVKDDRTEVKARSDAAQHTDISGSTMMAH